VKGKRREKRMVKYWKLGTCWLLFSLGFLYAGKTTTPLYFPTKPGSYAEYKIIIRAEPGWGLVLSHFAHLRVAVVGSEIREEKTCDWLEIDYFPEGEEEAFKIKILLPEESLARLPATLVEDFTSYFEPFSSIQEIIFQKGSETPVRVESPLGEAFQWKTGLAFLKPFIQWKVEEDPLPQTMTISPGKFEARYQTLHMRITVPPTLPNDFSLSETSIYQGWYSEQIPFALLKATSTVELHFQLPNEGKKRTISIHSTLMLEKFGSNARSLIEGEPSPREPHSENPAQVKTNLPFSYPVADSKKIS